MQRLGPERRWWLASLALVVLIYATLYFVRGPIEFLRERNLLRLAVAGAFGLVALPALVLLWRRRPGPRELVTLALFAALFFGMLGIAGMPEEKLHFLEYGLLGGMVYAACRLRARRLGPSGPGGDALAAAQAVVLAGLAGLGDEVIQGVLPNRFFDTRDIVFNVVSSSIVVVALGAGGWARRRDSGD